MSTKKDIIRWGRSILLARLKKSADVGSPILKVVFEHDGTVNIDTLCVDFNQHVFTTVRTGGWDDALIVYVDKNDMKDLTELLRSNKFEDATPTGK